MTGEKAQETSFYVSGGKIAAKVWGPDHGWPVLAVHGWLDNAGTFDTLAPQLAPEMKIVALDLSGHGFSYRKAPGTGYHLSDWLLEVHEVIVQLGWKQFSFMGHSMGGQIGAVLAALNPDRVRDLILLDTVGPVTVDADVASDRFSQHIVGRLAAAERTPRNYADREAMIDLMVRVTGISRGAAGILLGRGAISTPKGTSFSYDRRARVHYPAVFTKKQVASLLGRVCCPTLVLRATRGYAYERDYFETQARALRYKQVVTVDGLHHFHIDEPEQTAKLVSDFTEKNSRLLPARLQSAAL